MTNELARMISSQVLNFLRAAKFKNRQLPICNDDKNNGALQFLISWFYETHFMSLIRTIKVGLGH